MHKSLRMALLIKKAPVMMALLIGLLMETQQATG
jgi:type III secretory pathway component EscS